MCWLSKKASSARITGWCWVPAILQTLTVKRLPANHSARPAARDADEVIALLKRRATKKIREGMARYALPSDKAFGVAVGEMRRIAKQLGKDHGLALALWRS